MRLVLTRSDLSKIGTINALNFPLRFVKSPDY